MLARTVPIGDEILPQMSDEPKQILPPHRSWCSAG